LVDDTELQPRLGTAGRKRAEQNYSLANYVSRLDGLYQQLTGITTPQAKTPAIQDSLI
jgi:glycosyltransferase involved in cell wall biosynthesis